MSYPKITHWSDREFNAWINAGCPPTSFWPGLHLHLFNLTQFPPLITNLKLLTRISISAGYYPESEFTVLPDSICELKNLTLLEITNSKLTKLPESIGNLKNLESLSITDSKLTKLPESIGNLTKLRYLNLRNNNLKKVPTTFSKLIFEDIDLKKNPWVIRFNLVSENSISRYRFNTTERNVTLSDSVTRSKEMEISEQIREINRESAGRVEKIRSNLIRSVTSLLSFQRNPNQLPVELQNNILEYAGLPDYAIPVSVVGEKKKHEDVLSTAINNANISSSSSSSSFLPPIPPPRNVLPITNSNVNNSLPTSSFLPPIPSKKNGGRRSRRKMRKSRIRTRRRNKK